MDNEMDVLEAAKRLISDESKWTKGWFARDAAGERCNATDPETACFCVHGAVRRAAGRTYDLEDHCIDILLEVLPKGFYDIPEFNDHPETTHADVMALFDRAIKYLATGDK